jgi:nucleoside-diphosphate-sugar epimerase
MQTAYVTGGTGCVGRNVINELLREGWNVIAAHRKSSRVSRLSGLDIELREVDLHYLDSVRQSVREGIDAIFHVAGNTSHWPLEEKEQWKDNVLATHHLVQVAIEQRVKRFIYTSTGATSLYSGTSKEEAARIPSAYVRTKRLSELEVCDGIQRGLDAVITQPAIVFGAFDYNSYSQIFIAMEAGKVWVLPGAIEFCHARDVAIAHIRAFEKGRTGESYVLGGHHSTWLDVYLKIASLLNVPAPNSETPVWVLYAVSYPLLWMSHLTRKKPLITPQLVHLLRKGGITDSKEVLKSKNELEYQSASIDEMIEDCYNWLLREGLVGRKREPVRPVGRLLAPTMSKRSSRSSAWGGSTRIRGDTG